MALLKVLIEFRLEPRSFGRHDITRIRDIDKLFHRYRIKGESRLHFAAVHAFLQFSESAYPAYEIHALVGPEVFDAEYPVEYEV